MLLSIVVRLRPLRPGSLPATTGPALHGWFFNWLAAQNSSFATQLHDLPGSKPFTLSGLQPYPSSGPELMLYPAQTYWFRITSLDAALSELLLTRLIANPPPTIKILRESLTLESCTTDAQQQPWAGQTTWQALAATPPTSRYKLLFHSPTTFKSAGRSLPFPLPEHTFQSLAMRWHSFSQLPPAPGELAEPLTQIGISSYNLQTELALLEGSMQGPKLVAFRGWCEYTAFGLALEWQSLFAALAQFAFYAGTGYKTGQGFGQTRPFGPAD